MTSWYEVVDVELEVVGEVRFDGIEFKPTPKVIEFKGRTAIYDANLGVFVIKERANA